MTTIDDPLLSARGPEASEPEAEITLAFENNRHASLVFGLYDQNLARIERRLRVASFANGNHVTLKGRAESCEHARRVLEALYERVALGQTITLGDFDGAIEETARQRSLFPDAEPTRGA
ncbi:MAG: phosphate starvation-inducible protein PhoH, partial [Methylocystis sp.]